MNRLRDSWDKDLTPDEIVTKKENVIVFDGSNEPCHEFGYIYFRKLRR